MPFRTAVRFTARFSAPRTVTHHIARRAASSSAGPKAGSDTPWIIGSAVGFGTLGAFILFPSGKDTAKHAVPHSQEKSEINERAPKATLGEENVQSSHTIESAVASDDPKDVNPRADKPASEIPSKKLGKGDKAGEDQKAEAKSGGANANETAQVQKSADDANNGEEKTEEKKEEKPEQKQQDSEEGTPSAQDIKDSIVQAAKANVPEVAMDSEAKGESPVGKQE
ncbi:hypothetical protein LQV05_000595 [Cryptococcus neoformans]|nr:hypothetical protein J007_00640 [Cryptococcus neoformans var. grubii]OXC65278.1 hypothetical protein C358_00637 [Cryptococcus neoformans var. grubii MW-RSA852]UOH79588.1 hypothetical protein LQV05_000595 [Cryptococcus neoformans]